jgi:hypothetical protein
MQEHERMIRPALGAIVLICFFMPFLKISCANQPIASITGLDLALGKTVEPPNFFNDGSGVPGPGGQGWNDQPSSPNQSGGQYQFGDSTVSFDQSATTNQASPFGDMGNGEMKIDSEPSAAAALALAVVALLGAFGGTRRAMVISAAASGITTALLLVIKANVGGDMPQEAMGVISLEWTLGFWGAVAASAALAIFTFRMISQSNAQRAKPRLVIQTQYDKQDTPPITTDVKTQ